MAKNVAGHNAATVSFTEKESAGTQEVLRQKFQWGSKPCLNVATVRPLPRGQDRLESPVSTSPVSTSPVSTSPVSTSPVSTSPSPSSTSPFPVSTSPFPVSTSPFPVSTSPVFYTRFPDDFSLPQNRPRPAARRNITRLCPFSFDLRDSMQRVAREQKLEMLRMIEERQQAMAVSFRASGVRKYKPLVPNVNARQHAHPRSPVSRNDP